MQRKTLALFFITLALCRPAAAEEPRGIAITLEESLVATLENNSDVAVQRSKPRAGEQDVSLAESDFDLTAFGGVSYWRSMTPSTSAFSSPAVGETNGTTASAGLKQKFAFGTTYKLTLDMTQSDTNSTYAGLNPAYATNLELALTQPLLKGVGTSVNEIRITTAQNAKQMSEADFASNVMAILTQTQETYWDLAYLSRQLAVQQESVERARDLQRQIEVRVKVGVMAPIEITAAEATVAAREEELIGIRRAINNAQDLLKKLINRKDIPLGSPTPLVPADEPVYRETALNLEQLRETAYENRPDYRQAILALESKKTELAFNENQLYPTVDLQGAVKLKGVRGTGQTVIFGGQPVTSTFTGSQADAFSDLGNGKAYDYSVGLVLEYPLFNRGAKSKVAKSRIEREALEETLSGLRQVIGLQVLSAARDVEAAEQSIKAASLSRELAGKKLDAETSKYQAGTSTSYMVLQYQNDLAAAKNREIKAVTDYLKALAQLDKATGSTLQKHNISLARREQ